MDGAPYLRKIDLKIYGSYVDLSSALEKMISSFTIGTLFKAELVLQILADLVLLIFSPLICANNPALDMYLHIASPPWFNHKHLQQCECFDLKFMWRKYLNTE